MGRNGFDVHWETFSVDPNDSGLFAPTHNHLFRLSLKHFLLIKQLDAFE